MLISKIVNKDKNGYHICVFVYNAKRSYVVQKTHVDQEFLSVGRGLLGFLGLLGLLEDN